MIEDVSFWHLVVLAVAVYCGATVQGVVGLGVGLLLAPIVGIIEPSLLPGLPLWIALALPFLTLSRDWADIDWRGIAWALPARVPGTLLGVAVVAWATPREIGLAVGLMVLLAVVVTIHTVEVPLTPATLVSAGLVSGVTGTATSIGGPPIAIVYQHRPPPQVRGTLGFYFVVGAGLSLCGLWATGGLHQRETLVALALLPFLLLGFVTSVVLRGRVPTTVVRTGLLSVCAASSLVLIVFSLVR